MSGRTLLGIMVRFSNCQELLPVNQDHKLLNPLHPMPDLSSNLPTLTNIIHSTKFSPASTCPVHLAEIPITHQLIIASCLATIKRFSLFSLIAQS